MNASLLDDGNDDTQSVGFVKYVGTNSDMDDQSSYLSLRMGTEQDGYSDVESSGNIIKMSSKNSDSEYLNIRRN